MKLLPGFRDFYPLECARRDYIRSRWREVARRYGFVEYDGPILESTDLYRKKSGGELVGQLFDFQDKGERDVALRPEMTPSLARMVVARERDFKKPLKWFSTANFFRYEKQQRGRLREFFQLNCDILGEPGAGADVEMIALTIDMLRIFGFGPDNFVVRVSSRTAWLEFLAARGVDAGNAQAFLEIVDKIERVEESVTRTKLEAFGIALEDLQAYLSNPEAESVQLRTLLTELSARGLREFIEVDLRIVRGLAYYTGFVFEVFDRKKTLRALAGGGRYDTLLKTISDGRVDIPAVGFGMGDVVLGELIDETPKAAAQLATWVNARHAADVYVVIAKEERRAEALGIVQELRDRGARTDFPLAPAKVGKQFQTAEQLGARWTVLIGDEWPQLKIKTLATREERLISREELPAELPFSANASVESSA